MKKRSGKKPSKKLITLDDLASMMGSGFQEIRVEMHAGFTSINDRMDRFEGRMENVEGRLGGLEQKINIVNSNVLELGEDYRKLRSRVENLELKTFGSVQE